MIRVKYTGPCDPPRRAHLGDAGVDLRACIENEIIIPPHLWLVVPTCTYIAFEKGTFGLIKDRSGLASKYGIHVLAGVVDPNYRGEIKVVLMNFGDEPFRVEPCMRIAQIVPIKYDTSPIMYVDELDDTERGAKGFGSTGVK